MGASSSSPTPWIDPNTYTPMKLPQLPNLEEPPSAESDVKQAVAYEIRSCSEYASALYDHGALVIKEVDRLFEQSPESVTVAEVSAASARLGADLQAHVDASEDNGPRCLKSLEWCAGALEHDSQARVDKLSLVKVVPILSPVQSTQCTQLRNALLAHRSMLVEDIVPRLGVVQQVFVGTVRAENEAKAAQGKSAQGGEQPTK